MAYPRTVSSRRPLVLLESANLIAGTSNAVVMITIPWLILERTDSALAAGAAGALTGIPGIILAPIVGTMVDRWGRKTVSVGSDILSAASVALFPIADALGLLELWVILMLTLVGAAFDPAGYTARKALIPDVARAARTGVAQLNGLHEGVFMAGWVLGPVLGAAAIATVGPVNAMWFGCAAFLLAAVAVAVLRVPNRAERPEGEPEHEGTNLLRGSMLGVRLLYRDKAVWVITVAVAILSLAYMPTETVLLPVHFEELGRPGEFGLIISAMAGGAMIGAFGYGRIAPLFTRRGLALTCMVGASIAYIPMAFLPPPWLFLASGFLLGFAWGPMEPLLNTLIQDRFRPYHHGRIYGVQLSLFYAAPPLGEIVAGAAVEGIGVQPVLAAIAACLLVTAGMIVFLPSLRGLDRPVAAGPDEAAGGPPPP